MRVKLTVRHKHLSSWKCDKVLICGNPHLVGPCISRNQFAVPHITCSLGLEGDYD